MTCHDCNRETHRLWGTRCYACAVMQFSDFPHTSAALRAIEDWATDRATREQEPEVVDTRELKL